MAVAARATRLVGSKHAYILSPIRGEHMTAQFRPFVLARGISQLLLLAILFIGSSVVAIGQSTAALSGTVTDPSGAGIPNAKVVAANQATGVASVTQTDAVGSYLFPALPIGVYRIEVRCSGFQTASLANLKLDVATAVTQNVQLKLGVATETLEITADAATVDTATTSVGQVINDNVQNQITFQPPIDTLAEYKIDNSAFPAEYGRNAGAIVNLATRSGTNDYHGELFEFFRNNALDARNFFNDVSGPQAPFQRNEFGADFGGPIKKNKVFFFLAYEGIRQHQKITVSPAVPSLNDRAGVTSAAVNSMLALVP